MYSTSAIMTGSSFSGARSAFMQLRKQSITESSRSRW